MSLLCAIAIKLRLETERIRLGPSDVRVMTRLMATANTNRKQTQAMYKHLIEKHARHLNK